MALTFVTGNAGKLREARHLLAGLTDIEQDADGYPELQADTLEEVARSGLDAVGTRRTPPYFLEDAGLFIDTLHGFPGVYSAYAYKTLGCDGILRLLHGTQDRRARFTAIVAYRDPHGHDHLFTGHAHGTITTTPRGDQGFGFDPIFLPAEGDDRTFAQLTPDEKGRLSHRGAAMRAFRIHLEAHPPRPRENPS